MRAYVYKKSIVDTALQAKLKGSPEGCDRIGSSRKEVAQSHLLFTKKPKVLVAISCLTWCYSISITLYHHKATLPAIPKSSVAVAIPNAWKTRLSVGSVIVLFPFSKREICARCTPIRSPSYSWVRFCALRALRIASPK